MNDHIGEELIALSRQVDPADLTERAYSGAHRLGLRRAVLGVAVVVALLGGGVAGAVTLWPTGSSQQGPADGGAECATEEPTEEPTDKPEDPTQGDVTTEKPEEPTGNGYLPGHHRLFDDPTEDGDHTVPPTDEPGEPTEDPTEEPEEPTEEPTDEPCEDPTETSAPTEEPTDDVEPTDEPTETGEPTEDADGDTTLEPSRDTVPNDSRD